MKYRFIDQHRSHYSVSELCEALEVSASGYYRWRSSEPCPRQQEDQQHKEVIQNLHKKSGGRYGHRPIYHHLLEEGLSCGRDRVLRLMKELQLEGVQKKRFKPLGTDSRHDFGYSPNLLKELGKPTACNQVWVADTTYLATREGWRYLATVMDLYSRRILGWSISKHNDTNLVCAALQAAVMTRGSIPENILHHSDRGSTYASTQYQRLLNRFSMRSSMSGKGNCYDNAAMESFYGRYKSSSVRNHIFVNEAELRANVFDYIEVFYNRFRKHASLGYKNPVQMEEKFLPPMGGNQEAACLTHN
jgi:transposase InsO family protein